MSYLEISVCETTWSKDFRDEVVVRTPATTWLGLGLGLGLEQSRAELSGRPYRVLGDLVS